MDDQSQGSDNCKIVFKKRKNRSNLRTPDDSNENEISTESTSATAQEDIINWSTLDEFRELKRAKKRLKNGINVLDLLNDNKKINEEHKSEKREGGLMDAKAMASELDLGNTFSLETNRRDEDAELMKYVEEELAKRRLKMSSEADDSKSSASKSNTTDDLFLRVIPEHLLKITSEPKGKNEEMLSSQMLSGIPEVDLGIEERIRNIEKTEAARTKLLEKRLRQEFEKSNKNKDKDKDKDISLVPKNLASCFTRNNNIVQQAANASSHRFSLNAVSCENKDLIEHFIAREEKSHLGNQSHKPPKQQYEIEPVVVLGAEPQKVRLPKPIDKDKRMPAKDKPMDDYIFEKFKKQLKKH